MQTRRSGGDAQVLERTQLRGMPAMVDGPAHSDHVVGAVRVAEFLWTAGFGDGAEGGCIGGLDGGGVEVCGDDGAHCAVVVVVNTVNWFKRCKYMERTQKRGGEGEKKNESIENLYPVDTPAPVFVVCSSDTYLIALQNFRRTFHTSTYPYFYLVVWSSVLMLLNMLYRYSNVVYAFYYILLPFAILCTQHIIHLYIVRSVNADLLLRC